MAHDVAPPKEDMAEMSFLDHLEELRWSIFKGLGGLVLTTLLCFVFADWVIDTLLMGPTRPDFFMYRLFHVHATELTLQSRTLPGQFFAYWGTILAVGVILGSPIIIYNLWRFIEPGLYTHEKKGLRFAAFFATFFFILGISFGYCILMPFAIQFFAQFVISDQILNEFDISKYFGAITMWVFGSGILFELPVVAYFLAKMGLISAELLKRVRKYALIIILVLAAVFTPPDPISQIIVAIPLLLLYELSIRLVSFVTKRREKELKAAERS